VADSDGPGLEALLEHVRDTRRFDFTGYKRTTLERRVRKRMDEVECSTFSSYQDYLEVHPDEFVHLFNTLLINVTSFFRDPAAWQYIDDEVIPRIVTAKQSGEAIRVWSAGCATGEEAYSLAMLFAQAMGVDEFRERVKIYGTDVDEDALAAARHAIYEAKAVASMPPNQVDEFFEPVNGSFQFRNDLRRSVIFGRHDLVQDAPISRLDLLVCRNTLMYFNAETQSQILDRFHFSLRDTGFLFLGKAETLLTQSTKFRALDAKLRVFQGVQPDESRVRRPPDLGPRIPLPDVRNAGLFEGPIPVVIVDASRRVEFINRRARSLFGLTPDDVGTPLQDLQLSYRPVELRSLIDRAFAEGQRVQQLAVEWAARGEDTRIFDLEVVPLLDAESEIIGAAISFEDVTRFRLLQNELQQSNRELETAYEELQSTNEELETTNEELQSTIEELETTNEELQSTNEELETMNEELQSTNDELHVTNEVVQDRSDQLALVNARLESILTGLHLSVVVLDRESAVQVWNYWSEDYWGLRADEVVGHNFLGLEIGLPVAELRRALRACVEGQSAEETTIVDARNRRGRDFRCRVVCSPLRMDGAIAGTVLLLEQLPDEA
jgi:two-component system, chemotaxis family, CheB/CheR fusion protein